MNFSYRFGRRLRQIAGLALSVGLLHVIAVSGTGAQQPGPGGQLRTAVGNPPHNPSRPFNVLEPRFDPDYRRDPPRTSVPIREATFWAPKGITLDSHGSLFVADSFGVDYVDGTSDRSAKNFANVRPAECLADGLFCSPPIRKLVRHGDPEPPEGNGGVSTVAGGAKRSGGPTSIRRANYDPSYTVEMQESSKELFIGGRAIVYKITPGIGGIDHLAATGDPTDQSESTMIVAGTGNVCALQEGPSTRACLGDIAHDIAFDSDREMSGNMFVATDNRVVRVDNGTNETIDGASDPAEVMTIVAGVLNTSGRLDGDGGPARAASFYWPTGLAFDRRGDLYIADTYNHRIRKVTTGVDGLITGAADEIITTVAGTGGPGIGVRNGTGQTGINALPTGEFGWNGDGPAREKLLDTPRGIEFDEAGNLYVADAENDRIRKIAPGPDGELGGGNDTMTTVAGRNTNSSGQLSGRDSNGGVFPDPCFQAPCDPLSVKLEHPFGIAIAPCRPGQATTDMYISEWMNRRVRLISGVAECPQVDLAIEDITDTPDPVVVGNELKYTVKAVNLGTGEATGVKVVSSLPSQVTFRSASVPGGNCSPGGPGVDLEGLDPSAPQDPRALVTCSVGSLAPRESKIVEVLVTPVAPGKILFGASVSALNPEEQPNMLANNSASEETVVELPALPALPTLPSAPPAGEIGETPPPPVSGPPATTPIDTQSTITLAPPTGPGAGSPSTVPVTATAPQPFGGRVPVTGSLGFQAGFQPAIGAAPSSQAGFAAAGSAVPAALAGDSPEDESHPAPRYSMVAVDPAIPLGAGLAGATLVLSAACLVFLGAGRRPERPVLAWGANCSAVCRRGTRPAI